MNKLYEKLYRQLAIDYCCTVDDIMDGKIILRNTEKWMDDENLMNRRIAF